MFQQKVLILNNSVSRSPSKGLTMVNNRNQNLGLNIQAGLSITYIFYLRYSRSLYISTYPQLFITLSCLREEFNIICKLSDLPWGKVPFSTCGHILIKVRRSALS